MAEENPTEAPESRKKEGNEEYLTEAMSDLRDELATLNNQKISIETKLGNVAKGLETTEMKENELRKGLEELSRGEEKLRAKERSLQDQLDDLAEKKSKVSRIKEELEEV